MSFQFENAALLWGLLPLGGLFLYLLRGRTLKARLRLLAYGACFSLCLIGLARPQSTGRVPTAGGKTSNLFVAVDVSQSMLVDDVRPTRLGFAQATIDRFTSKMAGVRMSLFPFAADGYTQVPLTNDLNVVSELIPTLSPKLTTDQGTNLTASLETLFVNISEMEAVARKAGDSWPPTQVVLFSDGESHAKLSSKVLAAYRSKQIPIHTVGTGTKNGGRVPFPQQRRQPVSQKNVVSKLDDTPLKEISQATGGQYFRPDLNAMEQLMLELDRVGAHAVQTEIKVYKEFYPYAFFLAFLLFFFPLLSSRWEYVLKSFLLLLFPLTALASELSIEEKLQLNEKLISEEEDSDRRSRHLYNRGIYLLESKKAKEALEAFQESLYLTGDKTLQKKTLFNMGNTLLMGGKLPEAIAHYQQAMDTQSPDKEFEEKTDQALSENIALALKIAKQQQGGGGKKGKKQEKPEDRKGPKKNYIAQQFSEARKRRILDLISNEEQNTLQRLQRKRQKKGEKSAPKGKPW